MRTYSLSGHDFRSFGREPNPSSMYWTIKAESCLPVSSVNATGQLWPTSGGRKKRTSLRDPGSPPRLSVLGSAQQQRTIDRLRLVEWQQQCCYRVDQERDRPEPLARRSTKQVADTRSVSVEEYR